MHIVFFSGQVIVVIIHGGCEVIVVAVFCGYYLKNNCLKFTVDLTTTSTTGLHDHQ